MYRINIVDKIFSLSAQNYRNDHGIVIFILLIIEKLHSYITFLCIAYNNIRS